MSSIRRGSRSKAASSTLLAGRMLGVVEPREAHGKNLVSPRVPRGFVRLAIERGIDCNDPLCPISMQLKTHRRTSRRHDDARMRAQRTALAQGRGTQSQEAVPARFRGQLKCGVVADVIGLNKWADGGSTVA